VSSVCFCTLAIHAPYRARARALVGDLPDSSWVIVTDEPGDFDGLPVRVIPHRPTGPMAIDYVRRLAPTGQNRGAAAYHDKRFAIAAALEHADTAIFLDADSRIVARPELEALPPGLAVLPVVTSAVAVHLETCGSWRRPAFEALARELTGGIESLREARWCHETCFAATRDGREDRFIETWGRGAAFLQQREVHSGEGGVIGLAAALAGWGVDYAALDPLDRVIRHEGGGPKAD
jgi:hypothetical protein